MAGTIEKQTNPFGGPEIPQRTEQKKWHIIHSRKKKNNRNTPFDF